MPGEKLRVYARGTALVPDYERQQRDRRNAFVGWTCLAIGPEFKDPETGTMMRHAGFVKKIGQVAELPVRAEYLRELRDGCLWPADRATAQIANVKFDPDFGGEHDDDAKELQALELKEVGA